MICKSELEAGDENIKLYNGGAKIKKATNATYLG